MQIKKDHYYIVNIREKIDHKYRLLRKAFETKKQAKKIMMSKFPDDYIYFHIVKGEEAIEYGLTFLSNTYKTLPISKYDYPPEAEDHQSKKSFRTKYRRWKRDYKRELSKIYAAN